jgi:HK97 family phage major capsid protein
MAESIQAMRERRNALAIEARNLLDQNNATWNKDHQATYDANVAEIESIDESVKREQKLMDLGAEQQFQNVVANGRPAQRDEEATDERSLFNVWARRGEHGLSATQRDAIRNTTSTTTGSEGGYTVQTEVAKSLQDALKAYGGVRSVADVFSTAQGNDINYPNSDGTSETGELIAQNTTATAADPVFGSTTLSAYKFSSKVVAIPFELLQDSSIDIEAMVRQRLVDRLGRVQNTYFTTGTGTAQPKGVVTAAGSGKVGTTGQTTSVIYDDLVDLEHSVDPAYRKLGVHYMMSDSTLKAIRKIKDSQNRPIFVPGYEANAMINGGAPDTLMGTPIVINQDMAVMAANAKSILFAYFQPYKVRDVMEFTLFRFTDSAYTKLGQVGFLAWARAGGTFVDVGKSLSYYQNSAT